MTMNDFLENKIIDHVLRNTAYTPPATVYVGLLTAAPGENSAGTEVTGGAYARQAATFAAPGAVGTGTAGATSNTAQINFPAATANWGTVTHFALYDAASAGNMLFYGTLGASKAIDNGDTASFAAGELDVSVN